MSPSALSILAAPATAALLVLLGACMNPAGAETAAAASSARQCVRPEQVNGFTPIDRDTVYMNVAVNRVYRLELLGSCTDINWREAIAIRTRGGSAWICDGLDAELLVPTPIGPQRCPVSEIRRLSDDEVRAWREHRPGGD